MTNFEKWKVTLEQILEIIKDELTPHDMWVCGRTNYLREENFLEWANAPEEDDGDA